MCRTEKNDSSKLSALGMSDPVIESEDIKETQNVEGAKEDERGEGSEGDDEKQ